MTDTPTPEDQPNPLIPFTPVPRLKDRSDGWKPEIQRAFIEALADTGSVASACRMVGRSERSAYMLRRHPQGGEFAQAWAAAQGHGVLRLQDAVLDRALNGVEAPLLYHGEVVGTYRKHDNRLAAFILRNHLPDQYGADGRAPHAIDAKKLARLKKDWREEWEAEQEAAAPSPAEIRASIERKMEALRRRVEAATSPRAYAMNIEYLAQRRADDAAGWRPGEPYDAYADKAAALLPQFIEEVRREWPEQTLDLYEPEDDDEADWDEPTEPPQPEEPETPPGGKVITLKGGGRR